MGADSKPVFLLILSLGLSIIRILPVYGLNIDQSFLSDEIGGEEYDLTEFEGLDSEFQNLESEARESEGKGESFIPRLFALFRNAFTSERSGPTKDKKVEEVEEKVEDEIPVNLEAFSKVKSKDGDETQRGMTVYLFQGQYLAEPRLNRFIDGAMENLEKEMQLSDLDPIYFRILPKGKVVGRKKPLRRFPGKPVRRRQRRPIRQRVQRRPHLRPLLFGRAFLNESGTERGREQQDHNGGAKAKAGMNRRRLVRGVGFGRVDGLSNVVRDGDAEMQLFGNYTLIRSHCNIGPLNMVMKFKTVRGVRRAEASLDRIKIHTVTRVNTQGCEMVDFLLDRPHPEIIQIRNPIFPLANRVAKIIFSRLYADRSFLVARLREKTGLALLSRKTVF